MCSRVNPSVKKIILNTYSKSALTLKAKDKAIKVIEDFDFKAPKTKMFIDVLKALNVEDKKSLIVFGAPNNNVYLSSRNFKGSDVVTS